MTQSYRLADRISERIRPLQSAQIVPDNLDGTSSISVEQIRNSAMPAIVSTAAMLWFGVVNDLATLIAGAGWYF